MHKPFSNIKLPIELTKFHPMKKYNGNRKSGTYSTSKVNLPDGLYTGTQQVYTVEVIDRDGNVVSFQTNVGIKFLGKLPCFVEVVDGIAYIHSI